MASDSQRPGGTAKQRAMRIPLEYSRTVDRVARSKWRLTFLVILATSAYAVWASLPDRGGQAQFAPGPVAQVHAAWNDQCATCHAEWQPLRDDSFDLSDWDLSSWLSFDEEQLTSQRRRAPRRAENDDRCQRCHPAAIHHHNQVPSEIVSCSACHRDHQGELADLRAVADGQCLACHAQIDDHHMGTSVLARGAARPVERFGLPESRSRQTPHPWFRSLDVAFAAGGDADPGTIRFNHWLHLQPGVRPGETMAPKRLSDLPEAFQAAYRQGPNDPPESIVQLRCESCHVSQSPGGATYQPIRFDKHCSACHGLEIAAAPGFEFPHGWRAGPLETALDGALERFSLSSPKGAAAAPRVVGKTLGNNLAQQLATTREGRRATAAQQLAMKCRQCHATRDPEGSQLFGEVQPAALPEVWLRHARFDHAAHRAVQCLDCHARAGGDAPRLGTDPTNRAGLPEGFLPADDDRVAMIPDLDNCVICHGPRDVATGTGGARSSCITCHRYHGGDAAGDPAGIGLRSLPTERRVSPQAFIRGLLNDPPAAGEAP